MSMLSQFIYGKFINDADDFHIVAQTSDLLNQAQIETMVQTYRFWGAMPPTENARAIGIFVEKAHLVLCQAAPATTQQGQVVRDYCGRNFPQSRYVFIPLVEIEKWQRSLFQILIWLNRQPIPVFNQPAIYKEGKGIEIPPLLLPEFEPDELQVETVRRALTLQNRQGTPLLLDALTAVTQRRRILTHFSLSETVDFLKSFLLLLPISLRSQFSIVMGRFDEEYCSWADLLLNISPSPCHLPPDVIQLDQETALDVTADYVSEVVQPAILSTDQQVEKFLARLENTPKHLSQIQGGISPTTVLYVMPSLSESHQGQMEMRYLKGLRGEQWAIVLQHLPDDCESLMIVWKRLLKEASQHPNSSIQLFVEIWNRLPQQVWGRLVEDLRQHLTLATQLLQLRFLSAIANYEEIAAELRLLCYQVVQQDADIGLELAQQLAQESLFADPYDRFQLLDSFLSAVKSVEPLMRVFNEGVGQLISSLSKEQVLESYCYRLLSDFSPQIGDLLRSVLEQKEGSALFEVAQMTQMTLLQQDQFYFSFLEKWEPTNWIVTRPLLRQFVKQSLSLKQCRFEENLINTHAWFSKRVPALSDTIAKFNQAATFENWLKLATILYDRTDERGEFLEQYASQALPIEVFQYQLPWIAESSENRTTFLQRRLVWQELQFHHLAQLIPNTSQYIETIVYCLKETGRSSWIKGIVLHYLLAHWMERGLVNSDLAAWITNPEQSFEVYDWLKLQKMAWTPSLNLQLPPGKRPNLDTQSHQQLVQEASQAIAQSTDLQYCKQVISDCVGWGVTIEARKYLLLTLLKMRLTPEQTATLLREDCPIWGVDVKQQQEILQQIQPENCDVGLVLHYLDLVQNIDQIKDLVLLLERVPLKEETEQDRRNQFYLQLCSKLLQSQGRHDLVNTLVQTLVRTR